MENPFDDDISVFAVVFTRAIIAWNNVERAAQNILKGLSGGGVGAWAAITHLGNVSLKDALLTVADTMADAADPEKIEAGKHVVHFVAGMERLRAYRNFYVHNLLAVGSKPGDPATFQGLLQGVEAKGKMVWIQEDLTTAQVASFMQHCLRLSSYGEKLVLHLGSRHALSPPPPTELLSSIDRPTWPPPLKKNRTRF